MALTLAIFAALQVAMPLWVRPNLAPPDHMVLPVTALGAALASPSPGPGGTTYTLLATGIPGQPGAWILSSGPVNAAAQATSTHPGGLHSASPKLRAPSASGGGCPAIMT